MEIRKREDFVGRVAYGLAAPLRFGHGKTCGWTDLGTARRRLRRWQRFARDAPHPDGDQNARAD